MIEVVLVERDPSLAQLYLEELSEAGFRVRVRPNLEEAWRTLNENPAHILVTDASSTGHDPAGWLPRVRQVHGGPVLMLTPPRHRQRARPALPQVDKTSDLAPLISSLRGQTAAVMWSRATASC
jgi:DNA-binding response OmpR family regulator